MRHVVGFARFEVPESAGTRFPSCPSFAVSDIALDAKAGGQKVQELHREKFGDGRFGFPGSSGLVIEAS
jgi:hypothetical protein